MLTGDSTGRYLNRVGYDEKVNIVRKIDMYKLRTLRPSWEVVGTSDSGD